MVSAETNAWASACPSAVEPASRDCVGTVMGLSVGLDELMSQIELHSSFSLVLLVLNGVV